MTERRIEELRRSFESLSDPGAALAILVEVSPCAIAIYDSDGRCMQANAAYRELFDRDGIAGVELSEDPVLGKSGVLFWLRRAFAGETIATPTFWYESESTTRAESRRIALSARAFAMRDSTGEVERVVIAFRDETDAWTLSERRRRDVEEPPRWLDEVHRADLERRTNEEQFRAVFEHCAEGVMLSDDSGRVLDINESGCRILGGRLQEIVGSRRSDHFEEEALSSDFPLPLPLPVSATDGEAVRTTEVSLWRADGQRREIELRSVANYLPHRHLTTFVDVTERNARHRDLLRRESELARSQRIAQVGSWEVEVEHPGADFDSCLVLCSVECLRLFGLEAGSVVTIGRLLAIVHRDDRPNLLAALLDSIETGLGFSLQHRIVLPGGSVRVLEVRAEALADEMEPYPVRLVGTMQDVTDRARRRPKAGSTRWPAAKPETAQPVNAPS